MLFMLCCLIYSQGAKHKKPLACLEINESEIKIQLCYYTLQTQTATNGAQTRFQLREDSPDTGEIAIICRNSCLLWGEAIQPPRCSQYMLGHSAQSRGYVVPCSSEQHPAPRTTSQHGRFPWSTSHEPLTAELRAAYVTPREFRSITTRTTDRPWLFASQCRSHQRQHIAVDKQASASGFRGNWGMALIWTLTFEQIYLWTIIS